MAITGTNYSMIIISVNHNKLSIVRNAQITSNTINTIKIKFEFKTPDWDGLNKTAVFWKEQDLFSKNNEAKKLIDIGEGEECNIPSEMTSSQEEFFVGIYGSKIDDDGKVNRIVSNFIPFKIIEGCYEGGSASKEPTPDIYEQLLSKIKEYTPGENIQINDHVISAIIPDNIATKEYVDIYGGKIDKIMINGIETTISDKVVNIIIPTKLSEFINDVGYLTEHQDISEKADKTEIPSKLSQLSNDLNFVDKEYVEQNAGKIDKIAVNGIEQVIHDKTVDINTPTKISELINDAGYITDTDSTLRVEGMAADAKATGDAYKFLDTVLSICVSIRKSLVADNEDIIFLDGNGDLFYVIGGK